MASNSNHAKGSISSGGPRQSVFVERDYSQGIQIRFQEKFPQELDGKLDPIAFQTIIQRLNEIYHEAESPSCGTVWENCIGCCTCYLAFLFMESKYNKCLKKARHYLEEQNKLLAPRGISIVDPFERGMRLIEFRIR